MSQLGQTLRREIETFARAEVSSRSLGLLRILVCTTLLQQFTSPWVSHRVDDLAGTLLGTWVMFIAAMVLFVGWKTRLFSVILALTFAFVHLYHGVHLGDERFAEPVLAFQITVLLALTPCGRSLSVDRALAVSRARAEGLEPPAETMPRWMLELFVIQTATIYFWGAYDMADPAWFSGERLELAYLEFYGGNDSMVFAPWIHAVAVVTAWVSVVVCLGISFGMLIRRARPYVIPVALTLHFVVMCVFSPLWYVSFFTLMMVVMVLSCADPKRVHDFITPLLED